MRTIQPHGDHIRRSRHHNGDRIEKFSHHIGRFRHRNEDHIVKFSHHIGRYRHHNDHIGKFSDTIGTTMGTTLGNSATTLGDPGTAMGTTLGNSTTTLGDPDTTMWKILDIAAVELDGRAFGYRQLPDTTLKISMQPVHTWQHYRMGHDERGSIFIWGTILTTIQSLFV